MLMRMQIHRIKRRTGNGPSPLVIAVHRTLYMVCYYITIMTMTMTMKLPSCHSRSDSPCPINAFVAALTPSTMTHIHTHTHPTAIHHHCHHRVFMSPRSESFLMRDSERDGYSQRFVFCPRTSPLLLSSSSNDARDANHDEDHDNSSSTPSEGNNDVNSKAFTPSSMEGNDNEGENRISQDEGNNAQEITFTTPNDVLQNNNISQKEFDRAVLKARAQAKIDAILDSPEAPFDLSTELQKIAPAPSTSTNITPSISSPAPSSLSLKRESQQLETSIYQAISTGDFTTAQTHKTALDRLHMDDVSSVLQANSQFYRSFSNKDYKAMEELWLHDSVAVCVHPAREPIVGAGDVLRSWKIMFNGNPDATSGSRGGDDNGDVDGKKGALFQRNLMEPVNIRLNVRGDTGIVTCDEEVYTRRFVRAGGQIKKKAALGSGIARSGRTHGMELVNQLIATNVFRKVGGKWYMVHHHSAWHANSEAAKKSRIEGAGSDEERLRQRLSKGASVLDGLTAEGVLGIPGHEGFYEKKASKGGIGGIGGEMTGQSGSIRRVFTGSLDDLLNGGWKDVLGGDDSAGSDEDGEEHIILEEGDDDDDDMDDSIQEETIIIRNSMPSNGQNNADMMGFGGVNGNNKDSTRKKGGKNNEEESTKDSLRQSCIAALRNLATQGIISKKQKRLLLTDIILSSSKGEYSMVEVAYDLLCGESDGDDDDVAAEEFAEQCRVFAMSMPELPPLKSQ